jgi:hypothetical protein
MPLVIWPTSFSGMQCSKSEVRDLCIFKRDPGNAGKLCPNIILEYEVAAYQRCDFCETADDLYKLLGKEHLFEKQLSNNSTWACMELCWDYDTIDPFVQY